MPGFFDQRKYTNKVDSNIEILREQNRQLNQIYQPVFFRLTEEENKSRFNALIEATKVLVSDEIYDQLKELIKSRHPYADFKAEDYATLISKHLNGCAITEYGVWVYYPWSNRLVHLLDETEFIELRTSANKNKITIAERTILAGKKVGVIGLSVGQSVSVTLALERGCGELRLADFDTLELNNLNRIRTGVHNLGIYKAYSVAREIAEIDPFFKVVCFTEGITEENINEFLTGGGKLDVVIDECDSVNIKILCRIKSKALHIPVLMEASDRGTFDVERYDLHPEMPIMHGWLDHLELDFEVLKNLRTNEEKVPYMLPISGLETLSARMRASMIELKSTITTWPQLATAVTLGGALAADTCRRIFLGQFTDSGRYFVDLEALVPDTRPKTAFIPAIHEPALTSEKMKELAELVITNLPASSLIINEKQVTELVTGAIKAPSASNAQPWKWYFSKGYLFLFYEDTGILSFGDHKHRASYLALGAAIENLELTAYQKGIKADIHTFPLNDQSALAAVFTFSKHEPDSMSYAYAQLVNYIDERQTNRNTGSRENIAEDILSKVTEAAGSVPGASVILKNTAEEISAMAALNGSAERLKLLHPQGHYEFFEKELRWDDKESSNRKDGINLRELCISGQEEIALKMIRSPEAIKLITEWNAGRALEYIGRRSVATASAIGLITMPDSSPASYLNGGRAMERMWLTANQNGIAVQPLMTPLVFLEKYSKHTGNNSFGFMQDEINILNEKIKALFHEAQHVGMIFLFKLSVAEKPTVKSYRIRVDEVLYFANK